MGHPVSIPTPRGPISGWRADPPNEPKAVLVVIQEIFGVNNHIRHVVDRFAAHGYTAVAPALFDHVDRGVQLDYDEAGVARGRELAAEVGFDRALGDVHALVEWFRHELPIGVVGFCWGGTVAYLCNTRLNLPAVSYYGGRTVPFLHERLSAPMLFHFGERDPIIPPEDVQAHRDMHPEASIHVWDAGHGFNCDARPDYDEEASRLAMERTLAFFERTLKRR